MSIIDEANYDESQVPEFTLPDVLVNNAGQTVSTVEQWQQRRQEILDAYTNYIFGQSPQEAYAVSGKVVEEGDAFNGQALRKQVCVTITVADKQHDISVLIYAPKDAASVPAFMGLNFHGNHTVHEDPQILLPSSWVRESEHSDGNNASEKGRGTAQSRWAAEEIVKRGYALITIYYGDIDPDYDDDFKNGVHALYSDNEFHRPAKNNWATIAAWSWGLQRVMDYCEGDALIDEKRVAVIGHSRLGKTSLWTGAQDQRFSLIISNNSGCGGAALSRRRFGETIGVINNSFPHWFCEQHKTYGGNESSMPVDQHMLIALQAPRPVYVASAVEDTWADPRGEFLSAYHATPVYELFGKQGIASDAQATIDEPVGADVAYHVRSGGHDVKAFDWKQYLDFADKYL